MKMRAVVVVLCSTLASCGFQPLYQTHGPQPALLEAVYVDIIPNRTGQLLRQALQARLEGSSGGADKHYTLAVAYFEDRQALNVQRDNSTTRTREIANASWSLRSVDNAAQIVSGTARSLDGYNIIDEQFFYSDLSEEAVQRRLADAIADQIVTGLAVYFHGVAKRG